MSRTDVSLGGTDVRQLTSTDVRTDENSFCDFIIPGVHFLGGKKKKKFLKKQGHSETVKTQCMSTTHQWWMYSQNKHDRHTDSHFRLLEDNSPRDGRGSYDQGSHDEGVEKHSCHIELRGTHLKFVYTNGKQVLCSYNMIHVTVVLHVRNEGEHGDTYTYMNEKVIYTDIYTRHDPFLEGVKRMKIH